MLSFQPQSLLCGKLVTFVDAEHAPGFAQSHNWLLLAPATLGADK
jgi:hypothetical protein